MDGIDEDLKMFPSAYAALGRDILERERKKILPAPIIHLHQEMGLSVEQIAKITVSTEKFVKSVIDQHKKKIARIAPKT